jgi:DHA2 family multidrug resistance protein-like MFS transporter
MTASGANPAAGGARLATSLPASEQPEWQALLQRPPAAPAPDGLDTPQRYWAWAAILLTMMLAVMDGTITIVALPTIAADFGASASASVWIVNGYQLAIVMALLPFASLGEIHGYRRVYLAGIALFTAASLACALSGSLPALTVFRVAQGLGAAGLMSVNSAMLRHVVPKARLGAAIGISAFCVGTAATIGPTLAGFILSFATWPWLFALNVPLGLVAIVMAALFLPASDLAKRRFDWKSAILCAAAIGLLVVVLDSVGHGLHPAVIAGEIAALAVSATLLVRRELTMAEPMLPLDLLKQPVFAMSVGTSMASFSAQMLAFVTLPFTFQTIMGFSPAQVGILMVPWPLANAITAPLAGRLSDRHSPAILGGIGLAVLAAGLAALALLPEGASLADIAWRMALCGAGFGFFQSPNNRTLIMSAPKPRSGAAGGMLSTARLTGQTVGAALAGLVLAQLGVSGAVWALALAACFAALAAAISLARIRAFRTHTPAQ